MRRSVALLLLLLLLLTACSPAPTGAGSARKRIRIGLSMDTLQEERWQRDRDFFVAKARDLGADVLVQAANGDDDLQLAQAENMLRRGIDILVVVPHDATAMAPVVAKAHAAGVKVIAYDRLIRDADVDLYVSFDNERVGQLQAEHMLYQAPRGNYVYIGGAETDYNASMLRAGVMKRLQAKIDAGEIRVVYSKFTLDWLPGEARKNMEQALSQTGGKVDAVICGNDSTAGGVIQALYRHGLAGRIPVAGQDADLAAVQRIVAGTQTMTVYKPIRALATRAAEIAVAMAKGQPFDTNGSINNGRKKVEAYLVPPVPVDINNLRSTVIADGFHQEADVFGVPVGP